ncbi:unnamed protein product [Dicrocoelium dendriticum]|nr:unnamed protein product [Dicrocoelium dendriticum]
MLGKHLKHGFVGCFQHIRINGKFVDPRRRPYVGDAVDGFGLSDCASELCNGVDCGSNGTCAIVSGSEYECRCPLGTGGSNCRTANEVHLPQYNGRSYTEYTGLRGTSHSKTTLTLSFKPTAPTGLLLYQGFGEDRRGDFVAVLLMHSFLEVIFDLGSGPAFLRNPSPVAMGTWHKLHLWLIGRQGFLILDGTKQPETTFSVGPLVQLTLSHHLFLGFHPDVDKVSVYLLEHFNQFAISQLIGFRGCLQELLINGYPVRLIGDAISGINVVNCASHPCSELSSACGEFGECQPDGDDFTCSCLLGHTGRRCQMSYNPGLMSRISFTSSAFLEFSSPKLMQTFASPHFDLLMDIKPDDSKGSTGVEQILLALITGSPSEGYALVVYMTTQRYLRQSWIHYSKFTGRKVFHHVKSSDGNISIGNLDAGMKNVEEIRLATHVWHRIRLLRRSYSLVIYLNGSHIETQDLYIDKLPTLHFTKLFVGGVDATVNLSPHINESLESDKIGSVVLRLMPSVSGFTGCVEKLRINGMSINAADSTRGRNIGTC